MISVGLVADHTRKAPLDHTGVCLPGLPAYTTRTHRLALAWPVHFLCTVGDSENHLETPACCRPVADPVPSWGPAEAPQTRLGDEDGAGGSTGQGPWGTRPVATKPPGLNFPVWSRGDGSSWCAGYVDS